MIGGKTQRGVVPWTRNVSHRRCLCIGTCIHELTLFRLVYDFRRGSGLYALLISRVECAVRVFVLGLSAIIHFSVQIGHVLKGGPLSGNVTRDGQLTLC